MLSRRGTRMQRFALLHGESGFARLFWALEVMSYRRL